MLSRRLVLRATMLSRRLVLRATMLSLGLCRKLGRETKRSLRCMRQGRGDALRQQRSELGGTANTWCAKLLFDRCARRADTGRVFSQSGGTTPNFRLERVEHRPGGTQRSTQRACVRSGNPTTI